MSTLESNDVDFDASAEPIRSYLTSEAQLPSLVGQTRAFILLDKKHDSRNKKACSAFSGLPTGPQVAIVRGNVQTVSTYWPVTKTPSDSATCDEILQDYDFVLADKLRAVGRTPATDGPILLAIDAKGDEFYIDMHKSSEKKMLETLQSWNSLAQTNAAQGKASLTFASEGLGGKFGSWICGLAGKVGDSGLTKALSSVTPTGLGELVIGGTISQFACPKANTAQV
jgi:hypothetical protein